MCALIRAGYSCRGGRVGDLGLFDEGMFGQSSRPVSSSLEDGDENLSRCAIGTPFVAGEEDVETNARKACDFGSFRP
jgi:hypothetical protein